ncbi:hypothetical protein FQR65_LT15933 [Abscondita terminalis]|nr:hypothetical protein FQR65_LT15933 [Abscondita terminalis]
MVKKFAIVKYTEENDALGIIPLKWTSFEEDICHFPPIRSSETQEKLVRREEEPGDNWILCPIQILHKYGENEDDDDADTSLKKNRKKRWIRILASTGGKDVRSLVSNMIKRVMSDSLAEQFSYSGKIINEKQKLSFGNKKICRCIHAAARKIFADASDEKIRGALCSWLQQAKTRKNRRTATIEKGVSGFRSTGICPINPNIFDDEEFCNSLEHPTSQTTLFADEHPNARHIIPPSTPPISMEETTAGPSDLQKRLRIKRKHQN